MALPWLDPTHSHRSKHPALSATFAPLAFSEEVRKWILRFKYPAPGITNLDSEAKAVALFLARTTSDRVGPPAPDYVIPIPSHPGRFRERGFDPTYPLASEMANRKGARLQPGAIKRIRYTEPQADLDAQKRIANVSGAFITSPRHLPKEGHIWLVDDVITTGATLAEAARCLYRAGLKDIRGVCVARTVYRNDS